MKILLIRHAESIQAKKGTLFSDGDDSPLTEYGKKQAQFFAKKYSPNVEVVFSSPAIRAKETAKTIFPFTKIAVIKDFNEIDKGFDAYCKKYPKEKDHSVKKWETEHRENIPSIKRLSEKYPSGISIKSFSTPVIEAFKKIIKENKDKEKIAIVAHSGVLRVIFLYITEGQITQNYFNIQIDYMEKIEIDY